MIGPGDNPEKFMVHKEVACYHSPVFDAAFNSEFIEGQTQAYRLDDTTPRAFRLLVQWLYGQKLALVQLRQDWTIEDSNKNLTLTNAEDMSLAEPWILAEKMHIPQLQNLALSMIDEIGTKMTEVAIWPLEYVYKHTSTGSPLGEYMVSIIASYLDATTYTTDPKAFPQEMLLELAEALTNMLVAKPPHQVRPVSDFHVPVEEV